MSEVATVIDYASFLVANNIDALKAIPVSELHDRSLCLVHGVSTRNPAGGGGAGSTTNASLSGPNIYMYKTATIRPELRVEGGSATWEPRLIKPDDVATYDDAGRWVSAAHPSEDEIMYLTKDVIFAGSGSEMLMTSNSADEAPTSTRIDLRGYGEEYTGDKSNTGINAGSSDSGVSMDSIHLLADGTNALSAFTDKITNNVIAHFTEDALYEVPDSLIHTTANPAQIGSRKLERYTWTAGSAFTAFPAFFQDCLVELTGGGSVTLASIASAEVGAWMQVANSSSGDITLTFSGTTRKWFRGGGGIESSGTTITMARGGIATIWYESTTILSISGSGLS